MEIIEKFILRLRRITSSGDYFGEIDGVRFVAIMMVMVKHLHQRVIRQTELSYPGVNGSALDNFLQVGDRGVDMFFALSGFILFRILTRPLAQGQKPDLKKYFLRRLTRLEPPYIIISTIICLALVTGIFHGNGKFFGKGGIPLWESYLATITYTHGLIFGVPPSINPPGWSLEIEVQFYIIAPLLALLAYRLCSPALRLAGILVIIVGMGFADNFATQHHALDYPHYTLSLLFRLPEFLVGFFILELQKLTPGKTGGLWTDLAGLAGLIGLFEINRDFVLPMTTWECFFMGLFLYGALAGGSLSCILRTGWITAIGGMCYTLYLIHLPVLQVATILTSKVGVGLPYPVFVVLQAVLAFPITIGVGVTFYLLLEQPCMDPRWPNKLAAWFRQKACFAKNSAF